MGFLLTTTWQTDITQIPNAFIDEYMPHANGSFVKVYLYLLRHMTSGGRQLTIDSMADMLSNTEADILRALRYWEKQGILQLTEENGQLCGVQLLPFNTTTPSAESHMVQPTTVFTAATKENTAPNAASTMSVTISSSETAERKDSSVIAEDFPALPERHTYTPLQAEALKRDKDIDSCLSIVEALLGTTMSDSHLQLVLYLMTDLGFSLELVTTLYEIALARGKNKPRYIEAIALDWAKKGIRTSQEAEEEASSFNGMYKIVSNALGIKRALAPAEKAIIDKWDAYQFSTAIIEEACNRTVLQSGDTNLNYTSRILEDWHKKGVTTLKDIEECDKSYFRQKNATGSKVTSINKNKFQNFPQRQYSKSEYSDLEKQLLQK